MQNRKPDLVSRSRGQLVGSFTQEAEEYIELVSDWAVTAVKEITEALLQDGRPFDTVELAMEEQIRDYLEIRGNSKGWQSHLKDLVDKVLNRLEEAGISQDKI